MTCKHRNFAGNGAHKKFCVPYVAKQHGDRSNVCITEARQTHASGDITTQANNDNITHMNDKKQEFGDVVRQNKSTIYTVCYMFSKDHDEVADMFQEVLIKLWKGFDTFCGRSDIKTWIYRVALNTCITIDKKKTRHRNAELSMDVDFFNDREERSAQAKFLHRRISKLQPIDRAIVLLWLEDISYEEIAAIIGISTKSVSVRLVRIRQQLKKMNDEE